MAWRLRLIHAIEMTAAWACFVAVIEFAPVFRGPFFVGLGWLAPGVGLAVATALLERRLPFSGPHVHPSVASPLTRVQAETLGVVVLVAPLLLAIQLRLLVFGLPPGAWDAGVRDLLVVSCCVWARYVVVACLGPMDQLPSEEPIRRRTWAEEDVPHIRWP